MSPEIQINFYFMTFIVNSYKISIQPLTEKRIRIISRFGANLIAATTLETFSEFIKPL